MVIKSLVSLVLIAFWMTTCSWISVGHSHEGLNLESASESHFELSTSGKFFTDIYFPYQKNIAPKTFNQFATSAWLQLDGQLNDNLSGRLIYQGDFFDGNNSRLTGDKAGTHLRNTIREGYGHYTNMGWELKAGRQIISWGKSDVVNPTDFLSAKDYSYLVADDETRRVASTGLWSSWTPEEGRSPLNVTLVWMPYFAQSKWLISPDVIPAQVVVGGVETPDPILANGEVAAKLTYTGDSWDSSISAFSGWDHRPYLKEINHTVMPPIVTNLSQSFSRINALGADGSYVSGKWIYRGEGAYVRTPNNDGANTLIKPTHFNSAWGVERPVSDDFRIQGQFLYKYYPQYTAIDQTTGADLISSSINRQIAQTNALIFRYQEQSQPGATFRLSYANDENHFDAEIFYMRYFNGGDYLIRPKASYAWTDLFRTTLGVDYYGGPSDRALGTSSTYNSVFFEAKYSF